MKLFVDSKLVSPYAASAFVALKAKELVFELDVLDLCASEQTNAKYSEFSITGRVPCLMDKDFSLSESSAIAEYLEEYYPGTNLYPKDIFLRARARQIQAWLRSDLMALRRDRPTEVMFCNSVKKPLTPEGETAAQKLIHVASTLQIHGGANLFGAWSIADVDLSVMLNRLILHSDSVPENLIAYAKNQWQQPALQEWVNFGRPN